MLDIETEEGRLKNKEFSICMARNGGELSFGGMNTHLHAVNTTVGVIDCSDADWHSQYHAGIVNLKAS